MHCQPMQNFIDFVRNRPPAVVFCICLLTIAIMTFSLGISMEYRKDIVNMDAFNNWNNLVKYFNQLDYCVSDEVIDKSTNIYDNHQFTTLINVVNTRNLENYTKIVGYLDIEEWLPICPEFEKTSQLLLIELTRLNKTAFCALITGQRHFLPRYSKPTCMNPVNAEKPIYLHSESSHKSTNYCQNRDKFKVEFNADDNIENFSIFLSQDDKRIIYVHLMWWSFIILFLLMVVIIYASFYKHPEKVYNNYR